MWSAWRFWSLLERASDLRFVAGCDSFDLFPGEHDVVCVGYF
jgi:hypothetical protein